MALFPAVYTGIKIYLRNPTRLLGQEPPSPPSAPLKKPIAYKSTHMLRLDINRLHQAGALREDAKTLLAWNDHGPGGCLRAGRAVLFWEGSFRQTIAWEWQPIVGGRYDRPKFRCACGRGAYHLWLIADRFACRACQRAAPSRVASDKTFRRIGQLRKALGADPRPFEALPPPPVASRSRWRYNRLAGALRRAEAAAYNDLGRLLDEAERRGKDA